MMVGFVLQVLGVVFLCLLLLAMVAIFLDKKKKAREKAEEERKAKEETDEVIEEPTTPGNDLPWKDEETTITPKASNYKLKETKPSKADKFDALFEEED